MTPEPPQVRYGKVCNWRRGRDGEVQPLRYMEYILLPSPRTRGRGLIYVKYDFGPLFAFIYYNPRCRSISHQE